MVPEPSGSSCLNIPVKEKGASCERAGTETALSPSLFVPHYDFYSPVPMLGQGLRGPLHRRAPVRATSPVATGRLPSPRQHPNGPLPKQPLTEQCFQSNQTPDKIVEVDDELVIRKASDDDLVELTGQLEAWSTNKRRAWA